MIRWILLLSALAFSQPDLRPTLSVRKIKTAGIDGVFDVVEIFTVVTNTGVSQTYIADKDYPLVGIGLDSLMPLKSHNMPSGFVLAPGAFASFLDTLQVIPKPFAITVYVDPIKIYDQYSGNNVTSLAFDYHPIILIDTVKYCPPTAASQPSTVKPPQSFAVYSAAGQLLKACKE